MQPSGVLTGGCSCGRVAWRATGPVLHRVHCHCALCRKGSGAILVSWLTVERAQFAWTREQPTFFRSSNKGERSFCPSCGSKLTFTHDDEPSHIDLAVGSMDEVELGFPQDQIHGESRVAWLAIDPHLPFRNGHAPQHAIVDPRPIEHESRLEGGCLCGSFRYSVTGPPERSSVCHCGMCRRATGGVAMASAIWPCERYRDNGAPTVGWAASPLGDRIFCPTCGSSVTCDFVDEPDVIEILIGGLDDPHALAPEIHIFAVDAPSWLMVDDRRPRWPGHWDEGDPDDTLLRGRD